MDLYFWREDKRDKTRSIKARKEEKGKKIETESQGMREYEARDRLS